eukprot:s3355_g1.t1
MIVASHGPEPCRSFVLGGSDIAALATFGWQHLAGNIWRGLNATFGWQYLAGNIQLATFGWQHSAGNIWLQHLAGNIWLATFCRQHLAGNIWAGNICLATFGWQHLAGTFGWLSLHKRVSKLFVATVGGYCLWLLFVATVCGYYLWQLFVATVCGHCLWPPFVATVCGYCLLAFWALPTPLLETLESVEMVEATCPAKRPAFEGRWFFLCGLVVDATTRNVRRVADVGARPRISAQGSQILPLRAPPPVRAFDSPERPADPRRAVLPQHHRPVLLAVRNSSHKQ